MTVPFVRTMICRPDSRCRAVQLVKERTLKTSPWHWSLALTSTLTLATAAGPALAQGGSAYGNSNTTASLPVEPHPYHPGFDGSFWFLRSKSGSTQHKVFAYGASHKD